MASELTTISDWNAARETSFEQPVLIYKHSATCPTSAWAARNVGTWSEAHTGTPVYQVTVQSARPVSNQIANDLSLRHETPQAIVVHQGQAIAHRNHSRVTPDELTDAFQNTDLPA